MGDRRLWLVLAAVLVPAGASAEGHKIEYYAAASYAKRSTLKGFYISGAPTLWYKEPEPGEVYSRHWSWPADIGAHFGSGGESELAFMTGPRFMMAMHRDSDHHTVVAIFVQALVGGSNIADETKRQLTRAASFGGGIDLLMWEKRTKGLRLQADAIVAHGIHRYPRVSFGFVQRFEGHAHEDAARRQP